MLAGENSMNKRIQELAIDSGIYDCIIDPYDYEGNGDSQSSIMFDLVRFAELIIQECCDAVRYVEALEIKNHFGVE